MTTPALGTGRLALLAVVTFLLMLPETLPVPVLRGLLHERFGTSDAEATWFMSANMLGALLAAPLAGLFVDRTGRRRRLALWALVADAGLMQLLAHPHDYTTFLAVRVAEGACHVVALTLVMSLVTDAAREHRGRALGWLGAGLTLGVAIGAALGGRLGRDEPILTLHAASAVLAVAALAAALLLPDDVPRGDHPGMRAVAQAFRRSPAIRVPLLLAFLDRFTVGFFTTGFPLLLEGQHGVDRATIGKLLAAFLLPFGLLSYPFGRLAERLPRRGLVAIGSALYGLGVAAVGALPPHQLWFLMPVLGIASAVMFVPTLLWLLERAPEIGRSTAMASFHAAGSLGFLLGPLACGAIVHVCADPGTGYLLAFAAAGATEILGAALVLGSDRRGAPHRPTD